jgi:hypothetical protein
VWNRRSIAHSGQDTDSRAAELTRGSTVIKDLQVTLYDVFGYLLPGIVFVAALATLFWAIFFPQAVLPVDLPTAEVWIAFLVASYVAGHMAQALGNLIVWFRPSTEDLILGTTSKSRLPEPLVTACRTKAKETFGVDVSNVSANWLYRFCDDAVIRSGKTGERDVYIHREGFYRGIFVGLVTFSLATLALFLRLWIGNNHLKISTWEIGPGQLLFFLLLWIGWSWLAYRRHRRFGEYRVTHAMLGFLTVKEDKKPDAKKESA